ncbi:hypothetical protein Ancab_034978 [Ancistrocladus abbreviatus]
MFIGLVIRRRPDGPQPASFLFCSVIAATFCPFLSSFIPLSVLSPADHLPLPHLVVQGLVSVDLDCSKYTTGS